MVSRRVEEAVDSSKWQKGMTLNATKKWLYRYARPLELLRWQYHFEHMDAASIIRILCAFQNPDGGFAHAIEPDSWNKKSSPVQTWAATELLREMNLLTTDSEVVQAILIYLEHSFDSNRECWPNTIKSEQCPQASWWRWQEEVNYNPTAYFCGMIICFAKKESKLYQLGTRIAEQAVSHFLESESNLDGHLLLCYLRLFEFSVKANYIKISHHEAFQEKLQSEIKTFISQLEMNWLVDGVAYEFLKSYRSDLLRVTDNPNIVSDISNYIESHKQDDGTWLIPWEWQEYPESWAISQNWWKAYGILANLLFLKEFDRIETKTSQL